MTIIQFIANAFLVIGAIFILISLLASFLVLRWWMRHLTEPDEVDRQAPRVRTRVKNSPIETEIADALAREFPPHKRARSV